MKTIAFIGSDKNAGKTTVYNFIYKRLIEKGDKKKPICLTSTGINGEPFDTFEGHPKPPIVIYRNSYFITADAQLKKNTRHYEIIERLKSPDFSNHYILGKCTRDFHIVLEGPNSKDEVMYAKESIESHIPLTYLLIDGSIDRQFLGHPDISDEFFFSILISNRKEQRNKASALLASLRIPLCSCVYKNLIKTHLKKETKTLLFCENNELLFHGRQIPFLDESLKKSCESIGKGHGLLYLKGALSKRLSGFLAGFKNLTIILDNFTFFQNISNHQIKSSGLSKRLYLFHRVKVLGIFLRRELERASADTLDFPDKIPIYNLYEDPPDRLNMIEVDS
ncbi:MAG: hypothetical protein SWO11_08050 [Thermodesulfobacteriota bacterium]|nr:hypothetical protein [Thermodesulfobacteriota bacterium]